MAKTASLNIRLDPEVKKAAETIYTHYGLSLAEAVTVFLHQSCNIGGLPFELRPVQQNNKHETISQVKPKPTIQELFKQYPANFIEDEELEWGAPVGDEAW